MKIYKKLSPLFLSLFLVAALIGCGSTGSTSAGDASSSYAEETEGGADTSADGSSADVEDASQRILVGDEVYERVLQALVAQIGDSVTLLLDTDVQLTDYSIVLGASDYGGLMNGEVITVVPTDVTIDLNGHTLTGETGYPIFEVQSGYTLTIIDSSEAQSGQLVTQGSTDATVEGGGTYVPLGES